MKRGFERQFPTHYQHFSHFALQSHCYSNIIQTCTPADVVALGDKLEKASLIPAEMAFMHTHTNKQEMPQFV